MNRERLLGALALAVASCTGGPLAAEDLTTLPWRVTASDVAGRPWSSSVLVFTQQVPNDQGFNVEGYFDWFLNGVSQGRELIRGTLSESGALDIAGYELIDPGSILLDVYRARVSSTGTEIVNGTFGVPEGIAGVWSAVQTIPMTARFLSPTELELCWETQATASYRLETRAALGTGEWTPVNEAPTVGSGASSCQSVPVVAEESERLYRVVLAPAAGAP
ncbi:MAG: hypothetical protein J0L84_02450 [Verrucomicrobia bacterium]|nr:hypothetical protein [Verrucomicrobiota bacterium]